MEAYLSDSTSTRLTTWKSLNPYFLGSLSIILLGIIGFREGESLNPYFLGSLSIRTVAKVQRLSLSKSLFSWKPIYHIYFQCIIVFNKSSNLQCLYTQHCSKLTNFSQIYGFIGHFPSVLIEKKYSSYWFSNEYERFEIRKCFF